MVDCDGRFAWYELMTTDIQAASRFYTHVLGWDLQDASTPDLAYRLFTSGTAPIGGLIGLPEDARKMGATPRWMGYVGVDNIGAAADRIKHLGGTVYVEPTDTNIGRIAVVADPQTAAFALVTGLKPGQAQPADREKLGHVGWHDLLAADSKKALAFYGAFLGWQRADTEVESTDGYLLFSAGGQLTGGMLTKPAAIPLPFWVYYFNIGDIAAAVERVKSGGGKILVGPQALPDGGGIAQCADPQGAVFALQERRSWDATGRAPGSEVGWSTEWGGYSSKGRLVTKPGP